MKINYPWNMRVKLKHKSISMLDLSQKIKKDEELWYVYQSMLAMTFYDTVHNYKKNNKKRFLNNEELHKLSNDAANQFLKIWTTRPSDDD